MDLGVLEGKISRGLFSNSIFDPSVIGTIEHASTLSFQQQNCHTLELELDYLTFKRLLNSD